MQAARVYTYPARMTAAMPAQTRDAESLARHGRAALRTAMLHRLRAWARSPSETCMVRGPGGDDIRRRHVQQPRYCRRRLYVAVVLLSTDSPDGGASCWLPRLRRSRCSASRLRRTGDRKCTDAAQVVALVAIAITATLAVRNQNSMAKLARQASLLDLTHDTVFCATGTTSSPTEPCCDSTLRLGP